MSFAPRRKAFLIGGIVVAAVITASIALWAGFSGNTPNSLVVPEGKEIGTWVWDFTDTMPTSTMQQIVSEAADNHFNTIYLSIDGYLNIDAMPDGVAKTQASQDFENAVYAFISVAHQKNIAVDAEAGETDWGEPQYYQYAYDILHFVQAFNAAHNGKFRGVQYDVESYSLPQYSTDPTGVFNDYVGLVSNLISQDTEATSSMPLSMIVPYFYNPEEIVSALNKLPVGDGRVIVLAYRNTPAGADGSVALARPELQAADNTNVQVIVAQETGNVQPGSITFYGMAKSDLFSAVRQINDAFSSDHSYGGIAVDYLDSFLLLR